ncbi:Biopterin-dependent aromatic amino acid hydroxylase-domain-containing protein [Scenedesmus sp. NREL 46B-D3]|nr:Biopterin-dependent aromatic amino acid hydroxylase-domain-containing protein [Scenedesmus sp. NREL 46B-D3]
MPSSSMCLPASRQQQVDACLRTFALSSSDLSLNYFSIMTTCTGGRAGLNCGVYKRRVQHKGVAVALCVPAGLHRLRSAPRVVAASAASAQPGVDGTSSTNSSSSTASTPSRTISSAPSLIKIPRSIHEVDNGKILGFGADLSEDHPGFHDEAYKQRRVMIANIARQHEVGQPIPRIQYTAEEVAVWGTALTKLRALFPSHACKEFNAALPKFGFREDEVPQLQGISEVLQQSSGWQVRPVAGLMHPRDFLNGLAFRYFHSTQYMRHASQPHYTPEPDVVHELIGHVPMLADPTFAEMVQAIGVASLGADEKQIWHLTKVYWYTVEFGVVREAGNIKAFGSGILSSFGELEYMGQGHAELLPFDPFQPQPKMSYKDGYQKRYFVLDSFQAGLDQLRQFAATLKPGAAVR